METRQVSDSKNDEETKTIYESNKTLKKGSQSIHHNMVYMNSSSETAKKAIIYGIFIDTNKAGPTLRRRTTQGLWICCFVIKKPITKEQKITNQISTEKCETFFVTFNKNKR